jgi:hypothetical protein
MGFTLDATTELPSIRPRAIGRIMPDDVLAFVRYLKSTN